MEMEVLFLIALFRVQDQRRHFIVTMSLDVPFGMVITAHHTHPPRNVFG